MVGGNSGETRILAVASAGGHWIQMMRLRPAFDGFKVTFATTFKDAVKAVPNEEVVSLREASRHNKWQLILLALELFGVVLRIRPHIIISTGAAPGVLALWLGKLVGAQTIWIDSIANVEKLSMSGRLARHSADLWLTQWPHLVKDYKGLSFAGAVL